MSSEKEEEMEFDRLVANLTAAINQTLHSSKSIELVMDKIKHRGFTVELALAAHIVMYKHDKSKSFIRDATLLKSKTSALRFEFNSDDMEFLKSLRISASDEA